MQSPYPEPGSSDLRKERLYYYGVRRIQEVYVDPVVPMSAMLAGGAGATIQAAASAYAMNASGLGELDGSATPNSLACTPVPLYPCGPVPLWHFAT